VAAFSFKAGIAEAQAGLPISPERHRQDGKSRERKTLWTLEVRKRDFEDANEMSVFEITKSLSYFIFGIPPITGAKRRFQGVP
jgi:hypothetical protein